MIARFLDWVTSETYLLLVTAATLGLLPLVIWGRS